MHAEILRLYIAILTLRHGEVGSASFSSYNIRRMTWLQPIPEQGPDPCQSGHGELLTPSGTLAPNVCRKAVTLGQEPLAIDCSRVIFVALPLWA